MAEDLGERTELPTGRRLQEARQQGNVARSPDLASAVVLIGGAILIASWGSGLLNTLAGVMRHALGDAAAITASTLQDLASASFARAALAFAPILLGLAIVAYLSHAVQIGWLFTTTPLEPKLDRLNPFAGFSRLFGRRSLAKSVADALKLVAVVLVAYLIISRSLARLVTLPALELKPAFWAIARTALELTLWILLLLLVLGLADFVYQRWQHTQDLRMTKQEVKDERRSMEGDPQVKARRFRMMRDIALQRVRETVPTADVIVTNPTHFSVAIRYDADTMNAPRVVAKGVDYMAMRIRQIAMIHDIPMVERPPLARALYYGVDVGREIPPEHYQAVAELLAYVYRVQEAAA